MAISVRPARFECDAQELVEVLQLNLPYRPHALFFPWLYLKNPEGSAMAWVAIDAGSNRIVGAAAAFPRRIFQGATEMRGYLLGDFCIDRQYRSLGLALALQRACLEGLSAGDADFAVDLPSQSMLAVYNRLRYSADQTVVRHVKPLRVDSRVEDWAPGFAVRRGLSKVLNTYLQYRDGAIKRPEDWRVATEPGPWGEEFSLSTSRWAPTTAIRIARTAAYLNWRYREHPNQQYEMITARRGDALGGYLILHVRGNTCVIDDLAAQDECASVALLLEVIEFGRRAGVDAINAPWPSADPGRDVLRKCGFRPRESSPAVLLSFEARTRRIETSGTKWHLSHGDWET